VDARIAPLLAQDVVLDIVERQRLALYHHVLLLPGADGKEAAWRDVPDRLHRIVVENDVDGLGIVEVDPERHLRGQREGADPHGLKPGDVVFKALAVCGRDPGIGKQVHTVSCPGDVPCEEGVPVRIVDGHAGSCCCGGFGCDCR
jgi:hypothetical protein